MPAIQYKLLQENGSYLFQETGDKIILDEAAGFGSMVSSMSFAGNLNFNSR